MLNRIQIIGHLGGDPELRYFDDGVAVVNLSIAVNNRRKNRSGEYEDLPPTWFRFVQRGERAESIAERFKKGNRVYVEGALRPKEWTSDDGRRGTALEIVYGRVVNLERNRTDTFSDGGYSDPAPEAAPPQQQDLDVDDIPF